MYFRERRIEFMWNLESERLQRRLKRNGMTYETLARTAGLEPWQLRVILEWKSGVMDPAVIARLAAALDVSMGEIASDRVAPAAAPHIGEPHELPELGRMVASGSRSQ
jgi:transcriptional regulator with XRE-family HTH domain